MTSMTATRPTIAAPKMDAVKPPALHIARHTLACPTHHEVCAFYWVDTNVHEVVPWSAELSGGGSVLIVDATKK